MPEHEMSSSEALVIVKKLVNHYQAFKRLEAVLEATVTAESGVSKLVKEHNRLETETSKLQGQLEDLRLKLSKTGEDLTVKQKKVRVEHRDFMNGVSREEKAARLDHEESMASLKSAHDDKKKEIETNIKEIKQEREKEEKLLANAKTAIRKAQAGLEKVA